VLADLVRQAAAEDRPYTEIITHMIGGGHMRQRDQGNALRPSVETAYTVLGEDLYCAMCHDHPFSERTEMECYAFAACFAGKGEVRLPHDYKYPNGKPGDVVQPALLRRPQSSQAYFAPLLPLRELDSIAQGALDSTTDWN
jgi:hypothetical protein